MYKSESSCHQLMTVEFNERPQMHGINSLNSNLFNLKKGKVIFFMFVQYNCKHSTIIKYLKYHFSSMGILSVTGCSEHLYNTHR